MAAGSLEKHLPPTGTKVDADVLLEGFLAYALERGLELYPAQEEAILELFAGKNVILATPTGSGKSLVALALLYKALAEESTGFYTAPIWACRWSRADGPSARSAVNLRSPKVTSAPRRTGTCIKYLGLHVGRCKRFNVQTCRLANDDRHLPSTYSSPSRRP